MSEIDKKESNTEFLTHSRDENLRTIMQQRELTDEEAKMMEKREKWYNIRRVIEKIIYMLPSIIYSLSQLISIWKG